MKENVIVIGAGMGGLQAAIQLQAAGYQVDLYEQNEQPGGKMHRLNFAGHTFDVGPTLVMMPDIYREVYSSVGKDPDDYIELMKVDPMYAVYFADDYRSYQVDSDLIHLIETFEEEGSENAAGFLHYLADIYDRYQVALEHFIRRPFRHKRDMYNPKMIYQALKLKTFDSAGAMMARYIPNPDFQEMLSFQTLYIGVSPKNGPSLYNIIPMIELLYGVWTLKGGMHAMARGMARLLIDLGGRIHYGAKVSEIVTAEGKVKGIRLAGQENLIPGEIVISNADFPYTMSHLIQDPQAKGQYNQEKIDQMDYSCSCLVFYWAVDGEYPELEGHNFVISQDLDRNLEQIFSGELIDEPSIYLSIPSKLDPQMAPPGRSSFYCLIPVSELGTAQYQYDQETIDYYRDHAYRHLKNLPGLEDIESAILEEAIFTPMDFADKFSAYRGATFGLQPTLRQSNHWRPQSKSLDCQGLYFTGSSTHPGAGVPIAIEGGRICASEVRKDYDA
ncbi:phytoene desaturase family protein [Hutsoniella sourekii]|uniref:phytoene desaturase family protein n=1 Tax=Hutsoniella sourekii TaxID=87650 RepID=UPI0004ADB43A|nr:phytoene desaturase family protein [Hutsoniella sourekii]